jgi:hypothetical protein
MRGSCRRAAGAAAGHHARPEGHASALVVGKDGKVEARTVHVSAHDGRQWLIDNSLAGDRLIVEGLQKIQPGMPVDGDRATPAAPGCRLARRPIRRPPPRRRRH